MVSLDLESPTVWEETLETWAWLSIVWNERREERRALRDAISPSRVARRKQRHEERRAAELSAIPTRPNRVVLSPAQKREIARLRKKGLGAKSIAEALAVSRHAVDRHLGLAKRGSR